MARFYFDVVENGLFIGDREGIEFATQEAARKSAMRALPDMARDAVARGDEGEFAVYVRNATGKRVFAVSMTLSSCPTS